MGVVVWGYRGGVGTLRIPYKLSTLGGFRYIVNTRPRPDKLALAHWGLSELRALGNAQVGAKNIYNTVVHTTLFATLKTNITIDLYCPSLSPRDFVLLAVQIITHFN